MFAKHSLLVVLSRFILYRFSDIVHAQTQAVSSYLADKIGVTWNRLHVIPNSINFLESKAPLLSSARSLVGSSSSNEFTLFCVGNKFDQGFDIAVSLAKFHGIILCPCRLLTLRSQAIIPIQFYLTQYCHLMNFWIALTSKHYLLWT